MLEKDREYREKNNHIVFLPAELMAKYQIKQGTTDTYEPVGIENASPDALASGDHQV